jgi:hypothetical protein
MDGHAVQVDDARCRSSALQLDGNNVDNHSCLRHHAWRCDSIFGGQWPLRMSKDAIFSWVSELGGTATGECFADVPQPEVK